MEFLPIILVATIVILLCLVLILLCKKPKSTKKPPEQQTVPKCNSASNNFQEYNLEGYNHQGYNEIGKNRQGKYNRYYNVKCYKSSLYSEEGFLNIKNNPLYLTDHARMRMKERMGIDNPYQMDTLAFEAYQFGKSKLQLMKSERSIIEEKEQKYTDGVILIYRGYCYVFTKNNGLKTVYKNDRIKM